MKKNYLKLAGAITCSFLTFSSFSQNWKVGGNSFGQMGGSPPILGTMAGNNQPINMYTNGVQRQKLNGNISYPVNGFAGIRDGYLLLGQDVPNKGAFSMFHINGGNTFGIQELGYRNWMKYGMTITSNTDQMYMGHRALSTTETDAVIQWSNDPTTSGPDNMVFIFTQGTGAPTGNAADLSGNDIDGREIIRLTAIGNVGIGPRFNNTFMPQSTLHQHQQNYNSSWMQITNQTMTTTGAQGAPTVIDAFNGFRFGILGSIQQIRNGNALVYQQEERHLLFSTNANTTAVTPLNTLERMRITSINAPTVLAGGGYGVNNPGNLTNVNLTRVSISHDPANPVTQPLSLLHLGYNTGGSSSSTDGWRDWMDIGTFTSNGTDNMYVGLKLEKGILNDRFDAVINWGDNDATNPAIGPDNLRFIFTSNISASIPPANSTKGLEVARMVPDLATTLTAPNYGMMGIGDFSPLGPNNALADAVDAKLDIDGDLRIREVTERDTLLQVLVIDSNDHNRVHWRSANSFGLGNICGSATPNPLTNNWEIQLPGNTVYNFSQKGVVNITDLTNCNPIAKLYVNSGAWQASVASVNSAVSGYAGYFVSNNATGTGVYCKAPIDPDTTNFPPVSLALFADGDVFVSGTAYLANPAIVSDQQFKTNIDTIESAMEIVKQLKPLTFEYINNPHFNFPSGMNYGFIAQDVESIVPELVTEATAPATIDTLGNPVLSSLQYKALSYQGIIPILTKAIQEQQANIDSLEELTNLQDSINDDLQNQLNDIKACLQNANICTEGNRTSNNEENEGKVIELENLNAIILDQNLPNPFAEKTSISYIIPNDVKEAQLLFYDMNGRIIKQVDISERGEGKLTVYGENLQNGIYTYSLIADGKLIATKKMVKH